MVVSSPTPSIAVIIATRNRPDHLAGVLEGLAGQSVRPTIVVICDSSDPDQSAATDAAANASSLRVHVTHTTVKSLTSQKNKALDVLQTQGPVEFVQVLDDDTVPDPRHLETLSRTLRENSTAIGVSGVTVPLWRPIDKGPLGNLVMRVCGLSSNRPGAVTAAGVGIPVMTWVPEIQSADWLFGCSMWRASIFEKERYASDFLGSGLGEDVEFSTRARRHGCLLVNPNAKLDHASAAEGRPDAYLEAYRFVRYRRRVAHNVRSWRTGPAFALSVGLVLAARASQGRRGLPAVKGTLRGVGDEVRRKPLM